MAFDWNGFDTSDGSYDTYSRACITAFYGARLERDVATYGSSDLWLPTPVDPADDAHSFIAAIGPHFSDPRGHLGGIGAVNERMMDVVYRRFGGSNSWAYFAHPDAEITPTSAIDGSDFKTRIGRAKAVTAMGGPVRRVVPRRIGSDLAHGFDQFGQTVAVGARAIATVPSGPYAGGNRVVEWTGTAWTPAVPQLSARPDMVEAGDIAPEVPPSADDPDGSGYQDILQQGDYMGVHLWKQARDVYNLCWKFLHSAGTFTPSPENDNLNQTGYVLASPRYFDRLRMPEPSIYSNSARRRTGIFGDNGPPGGTGWAFNLAGAETAYDANADIYGAIPEARGEAVAYWDQKIVGPSNIQWIQYQITMQGFEAELLWTPLARHRKAKLSVWVHAQKITPGGGYYATPVYDDYGTGLVEGQWNLVSEHVTAEDRTPAADKRLTYRTGDLLGLADPGEYPTPEQPPDPSPPPPNPLSLIGSGAPTYTSRGFTTGQYGSNADGAYTNIYPSGVVDWSEGFDYLP